MTKLLHVSASPRGATSASLALAEAFTDSHRAANPDLVLDHVDLFEGTLPAFGRLAAEAKMSVFAGGQPTPEQTGEWDTAKAVYDRSAADAYLFSVPMWNAGVPYVLKQRIDLTTQPGWTFTFTPTDGYTGNVHGKTVAVVDTSGVYSPGAPLALGNDSHSTFFNDWLRFVGIDDVTEIRWQPNVLTASPEEDRVAAIGRAADPGSRV